VTHDNVEGVDITIPIFQFSETHYLAPNHRHSGPDLSSKSSAVVLAQAIVQTTVQSGRIELSAESAGLKSARFTLESR
jgi:hypothetical protein